MSVARVTEITSSSTKSFDDAIEMGVNRAMQTLQNVEGVWIQEQKIMVENGRIASYRVNMQVTFRLTD
jgi:dodecin